MTTHPAYPAARAAALRVNSQYGQSLDVATIEAMIDVAFWASLRREETYTPKVSLAFVEPSRVDLPLIFETPVPLASQPLTRLGPAVERPGIHLCVRRRQGDLEVWGAARHLPEACFVLEVVAPGLLVLKNSRGGESGKFFNVAVLQGDEIKVIDRRAAAVEDCPDLLSSLMGLEDDADAPDSVNVLIQLAVSMRAHGRGGTLLVVPGDDAFKQSILQPVMYAVAPAFRGLVELLREDAAERSRRRWQESLHRMVEGIGGLTAVDGATIITDRYEVLAFGAKIVRRHGWEQVSSVLVTEPIEGTAAVTAEPGQLGGTRHLSAAQFAHDQRDAIALVASQDGRFTVFGWSACAQTVHARRIEALLL